jgi:hypothetical protein
VFRPSILDEGPGAIWGLVTGIVRDRGLSLLAARCMLENEDAAGIEVGKGTRKRNERIT